MTKSKDSKQGFGQMEEDQDVAKESTTRNTDTPNRSGKKASQGAPRNSGSQKSDQSRAK